jgi:osmotically-inducible protein OsmY
MANLDSTLAVALGGRLERDKRTANSQIDVISNNGVVTLSGFVLSNKAHSAAVEIAMSHPGVLSVINDLEIDDPDATTELSVVLPLPATVTFQGQ